MEPTGGRLAQQFGNSDATNGAFSFQGNVYGNIQISRSHDRPPELINSLPEAAFNAAGKDHSPSCLENTRRNVLEQIENWADSDGKRRIYWLKGMAGIGKSTIALTVARKYARLGRLGASFFFSRGDGDLASAKKFATAIASQLADALPQLRSLIEDAITSNSRIHHLGLYEQWEKLVLEPLRQLGGNRYPHSIIVVVDALDECDNEDDISLLIQCLAAATIIEGIRLHVFLTSRPEQPISLGFDSISRDLHHDFILHDIEQSIIDQDLVLFYKDRLARTAKKFGLGDHLLSDETVQSLVRKSNGLFIHAATVCRFIEEGGQLAGERLSLVIAARNRPSKPEKELDQMYTSVLTHSLPTQLEPEELAKVQALFRLIVGSIVVLSEAMRPPDLAAVVEEPTDVILSTLHPLHSLFDVHGETRPVRLLHPSLRDFLLDPARCQNKTFLVDAEAVHFNLFSCCLRIMKNHLRRNICNIERPGTRVCDVPKVTVEKSIPLPLQYACCYWIYHLRQSGVDPNDSTEIMDFFQTRFIHWLETLALIGRLSEGINMIRWLEAKLALSSDALSLKGNSHSIKLRSMLSRVETKLRRKPNYTAFPSYRSTNRLYPTAYDAMRFVLSHSSIIEETPLQAYCSALLFSPEKSIIRTHHLDEIPKWILRQPKTLEEWSPYLQTLKGHSGSARAVVFSPDGRLIASGSGDETVRLWDATTGTERRVLKGHSGSVIAVVFSRDGRLITSASDDETVRFWDATTGTERGVFRGHSDPVEAIAFSPDGRLIVSASVDGTVRLWDATTGTERRVLRGHSEWVKAVTFSPDARLIASASFDETVRLWDATTGTERRVLKGHSGSVIAVVFSPDGRLIASGSGDETVRLWDATTGTERRVLKGHSSYVTAVAFSPDSRLIASGSDDGTVRLWDATTGRERRVLKGHSSYVTAVAFSPDGRLIASGSSDKAVRLWDATTSTQRRVFKDRSDPGSVKPVAFSPDGRLIASASDDGTVRLWDATTGTERRVLKGHSSYVTAVAFSPDSRLIASGSGDETVRLWDATTGTEWCVLRGHLNSLSAVAFSPDGRLIVSASVDGTIRLWDATTGREQRVLKGHSSYVTAVAFSPDGRLIASGSFDKAVRLWDATTGREQRVLKGHSSYVTAVAFSPDARLIASASFDETVRLWDATTGTERRVLRGHSHSVEAVAFSPDGRLIVSASVDGTVRLWDVTTGTQEHVYVIKTTLRYLSFCETLLITDRGILQLPQAVSQAQHYIFASGTWVQEDGENILSLHPDYMDRLMIVSRRAMVFRNSACSSILLFDQSSKSMIAE